MGCNCMYKFKKSIKEKIVTVRMVNARTNIELASVTFKEDDDVIELLLVKSIDSGKYESYMVRFIYGLAKETNKIVKINPKVFQVKEVK